MALVTSALTFVGAAYMRPGRQEQRAHPLYRTLAEKADNCPGYGSARFSRWYAVFRYFAASSCAP